MTSYLSLKTLMENIVLNGEQFHILAGLRGELLLRLISGEVRVKMSEKFLEKNL